jgi:multicomponent Na+:H+ antiporter subunit D
MTESSAGLVVSPVLVPLLAALWVLLLPRQGWTRRVVCLAGHVVTLASSVALLGHVRRHGPASVAFGGWELPFAIEFSADRVGALFVLLAAVVALAVNVSQTRQPPDGGEQPWALNLGFLAGANGAFLTADLFNLYVWFEVVLMSSLGLLVWGHQVRHLDAALRYFVLNVVGTVILLVGVSCVYAVTGHLNFAAITDAGASVGPAALAPFAGVLIVAFLIKAAVFPVFAWLPATYHTLPTSQAALFAGIGTKLGVYALLRLAVIMPPAVTAAYGPWLGWLAVATMTTGVLGAAYHWDSRRILAFHSISQVGYMLLGIALGTAVGIQATLVFALHHGLVKSNLFLVGRLVGQATGSYDVRAVGGQYTARPWLALIFLSQALSLIGVPPSSGFWAKLLLVRETVAQGHAVWAMGALAVGLLTLYSMLKIWVEVFWKDHPRGCTPSVAHAPDPWTLAAVIGMGVLTMGFGLYPDPVVTFAASGAAHLFGGETP